MSPRGTRPPLTEEERLCVVQEPDVLGSQRERDGQLAAQVDPVERLQLVLEQTDPSRVVEGPRRRDTGGIDASGHRGARRVADAVEQLLAAGAGDELRAHLARRDDGCRADVDGGGGHVRAPDVQRHDPSHLTRALTTLHAGPRRRSKR